MIQGLLRHTTGESKKIIVHYIIFSMVNAYYKKKNCPFLLEEIMNWKISISSYGMHYITAVTQSVNLTETYCMYDTHRHLMPKTDPIIKYQ